MFVANPPVLISALLLSASPAVAQFDRDNNCIRNKESEMHRIERLYQTAYQEVLNHENMPLLARQMEEAGRISKDLGQAEKNGMAYKFMTDELGRMKSTVEAYKTYPNCSTIQGGQQQ